MAGAAAKEGAKDVAKDGAFEKTVVGRPMPAFTLPDAAGQPIDSASLLGRGPLVIFFYPKDETAVCTREACAFRDSFEELQAAGAAVVGISRDDAASHTRFAARHKLPYLLLTDADGAVARRFGVRGPLGLLPGRETFVIDEAGVIRGHVRALFSADKHVDEALAVVRQLAG